MDRLASPLHLAHPHLDAGPVPPTFMPENGDRLSFLVARYRAGVRRAF